MLKMKKSFKIGLSFGLTSGIITTLGLIVGLNAGTQSKLIILGGILIIAIADAFSDSLGMHLSEESERKKHKDVWKATFATFFSKFFFALTFIIPILLFELNTAIIVSIIYGLTLIAILSYNITPGKKWKAVLEHLGIAIIVIILTNFIGEKVSLIFGV